MRWLMLGLIPLAATGCTRRMLLAAEVGFLTAETIHAAAAASEAEEAASAAEEAAERRTVIYVPVSVAPPIADERVSPPPRSVPQDDARRPFDATAARAALDQVDPGPCWKAPTRGYGHARVTYRPTGEVDLVEITNPLPGPEPDKACIAERYRDARVPAFRGEPVRVSATFYVRP